MDTLSFELFLSMKFDQVVDCVLDRLEWTCKALQSLVKSTMLSNCLLRVYSNVNEEARSTT